MRIFEPRTAPELAEWLIGHHDEGLAELLVTGEVPDWRRSGVRPLPALAVSTAGLADVIELRPADLTVEIGAGMRVAELRRIVENEGLWLPLVDGAVDRSVGGLVAEAPASAFDWTFGPIRRHVLACTIAMYDGRLTRWGRAVMKNVAGYDVPRLVCGSRARLGILTSVTLRLWPRPDQIRRFALRGPLATLEGSNVPRTDGLTARWKRGREEVDGEAILTGGRSSVQRRTREMQGWATAEDLAITEVESGEGAQSDGSGGHSRRSRDEAVYRVTFGRRYLSDGREGIERCLERAPGAHYMRSFPASGVVSVTLEGLESVEQRKAPAWFNTIVDPLGGRRASGPGRTPTLRVERGGPAEHEAARRLRPAASRHFESRVVSAFGGREATWQADYL